MQKTVGGYITALYPFEEKVAVVANDEALINNLPFNRSMPGGYGGVFGTFFVCGLCEDDFCSLTDEQVKRYGKMFHKAEILLGVKGNDVITLKVEPTRRHDGKDKSTPPPSR